MATVETLLTAEEYARLPENGTPTELVRGKVVAMNVPYPRHGEICSTVVRLAGNFLDVNPLGRLVCNDAGILTERDPDTVRGADVAFYSYQRYAKGPLPQQYLPKVPELVFEVLSPSDSWKDVLAKVAEYLRAGVTRVCVLDPQRERATVYAPDQPEETLTRDQELTFPNILPGFSVAVWRFFA